MLSTLYDISRNNVFYTQENHRALQMYIHYNYN